MNIGYDEIEAESVEDAMEQLEEAVRRHIANRISFYEYLLRAFE